MQRTLLLLATLCVFFFYPASAQTPPVCGSDEMLQDALRNPAIQQQHLQLEDNIFQRMSQVQNGEVALRRAGGPYLLPVVVHIIHNGGSENISDAQVLNAIKNINDAFANIGYYNPNTGVPTNIQFCLAKQDPQGAATNGIVRVQSTLTDLDMADDVQMKNLSRWSPTCYVNIWIVKEICSQSSGCGVAGYAYFPSAHGGSVDGLVVEARYFGTTQANDAVGVHELGHYLGLYHTFQGGCTNNNCLNDGDKVCDTPPDGSTAAVSCGATANTCTTDALSGFTSDQPDNFSNYMDYGYQTCQNMFTQGQVDRMHWHIDNVRYSLLNCTSCNDPCTSNITAQFASSTNNTVIGAPVTFTNQSANAATYNWFVNGTQFSSAASPNYTFNTAGTYVIRMQAIGSDPNCIDYFSDTIRVTCGVLASFTSSTTLVNVGGQVTFTNTSVGATSVSWFVDGVQVSNSLTTYTHTFNTGGSGTVHLVAGGALCSDTSSLTTIQVGAPCRVSFTHSPQPATTCLPVTFTPDGTCDFNNYYWSFCQPASFATPAIQSYNVAGPFPDGSKLIKDHNGNYHFFYLNYNSSAPMVSSIHRLSFGNSINNTPVIHDVYTPSLTATHGQGIDVVYSGGNYYGFGLYDNKIFRLDFGATITDTPAVTQLGGFSPTAFDWGHKLEVVQETNTWWILVVARNTSSLNVLYLGNNISGNVLNDYSTPCAGCWGFSYQKVNNNHYVWVTSFINGMRLMSFGNSLANTPTAGAWATYGQGLMGDVALYQNCDGSFDGIIVKENVASHTFIHLDSITATPAITVMSFTNGLTRTGCISRFMRTDAGLTAFVIMSYGNAIGKLDFPDCGLAYSTDKFPPPVYFPAAGSYSVRLAVDEGLPTQQEYCSNITVSDPNSNQLDLGPDVVTCANGVFPLDAGNGFKTYLWDDGTTDPQRTVFSAGTFWVETTDSCNNIYRDSITITVDQATSITLNNPTICEGDSVTLTAPPGFASYVWTPATALSCPTCATTVASPTDTTIYTVNATTANGCVNAASAIVSVANCDSTLPLTAVLSSSITSCIGLADGAVYVDVFGGVPPYQLIWNTGHTNDTVLNLAAGEYTVTVTDDAGTSIISNVFVNSPAQLIIITSSYTAQLACAGDTTGAAKVYCTGGTPPYTFTWSNGFAGDMPINLAAGTHVVTATDGNGCTASAQIVIHDGADLSAAQILGPDTVDTNVPASFITDAGYNYAWSSNSGVINGSANLNSVTLDWENEGTDTVQVIVSILGCKDTLYHPVVLLNLTSIHEVALNGVELYPNPSNGGVTVRVQLANVETELLLFDALGKKLFERSAEPATIQSGIELDLTMLAEGIYFLHLKTGDAAKVMKVVKY